MSLGDFLKKSKGIILIKSGILNIFYSPLGHLIPDELYIRLMYRIRTRKKLNLKNPKTFNEKLQWLKLHDRKSVYTDMVDKEKAKKYVADRIGEKYIVPTIGVWDKFEEIDFSRLPNQFVLKCTHDSGGLVICRDKNNLDIKMAKKKIDKSLKRNFFYIGREWPYKNVSPRIIAEEYMTDENQKSGLIDYKFFCFNGKVRFLYVSENLTNHEYARISFLSLDWVKAPFCRKDYKPFEELPRKPYCLEEMVLVAEKLSKGLKFLRVDLYEVNKKIYFSELTFYPCNGLFPFQPEEWDERLGKLIDLAN